MKMDENSEIITVANLILRACPCTGTSSLRCGPNPIFTRASSSKPQPLAGSSSSNPKLKILTPFEHPAILVGILTLNYSDTSCLQFTDNTSDICCEVLDYDVSVIGKKIYVVAWNFFPLKSCKGFLEIISWKFADSGYVLSRCVSIHSFNSLPLVSDSNSLVEINDSKSRYRVHGAVESISPVSLVPCSRGGSLPASTNVRGFLVRVMSCQCNSCSSKESIKTQDSHSYAKPVFIYFCGAASYFRPVMVRLVGKVITVSGLKKKLIFIGIAESRMMFVTSESSVVHVPTSLKKPFPDSKNVIKGKGECGMYTGVVKGVYMQGMVIELDNEVWLLLTDKLQTMPHSLRVGAIISVQNVHFVNPRFSWAKVLILGACFKTSIVVESFSPLESGCYINVESQSQLGKFIDSLSFSAKLWALLVVSSIRKKFSGILSEKEILGSKDKKGMAQMYISSHIPRSAYQVRHGIFTEICKHETCSCCCESYCGNLKMVLPISSIIDRCEALWTNLMLHLHSDHHVLCGNGRFSALCCEGKPPSESKRRIFPSEDLGVVLLGILKVSATSGRLQLVDKTGSIDVIVPKLSSTWNNDSIYEVIDYCLSVEGMPERFGELGWFSTQSFSCRSIFNCSPLARNRNISVFGYFLVNNATGRNLASHPCEIPIDHSKELESGNFHLIRVTHKFPRLKRFRGDPVIADTSSMFVEAVVLPWDLVLSGEDGKEPSTKIPRNQPYEFVNHCAVGDYKEHVPRKRHKSDYTSSMAPSSYLMEDLSNVITRFKTFSDNESGKQMIMNFSHSHEIPCLATFKRFNNHDFVSSGVLCCTKARKGINTALQHVHAEKVLLEFNYESFFKYQLLHVGGYYIMKHNKEDSLCNVKGSDKGTGVKVLVSPRTQMWSIAFCSDEDLGNSGSLKDTSQDDSSISGSEFLVVNQVKPFLRRVPGSFIGTSADVHLHLPGGTMHIMELCHRELGGELIELTTSSEGTYSMSTSTIMPGLSAAPPDTCFPSPEGKDLISLQGDVVSIHEFDDSSANLCKSGESFKDVPHPRFLQEFTRSFCIHVLVDGQSVVIFGPLHEHAYLIGFGPGVNATFHRILDVGGQNRWMLIPVSFIVINSIRAVNGSSVDKFTNQKTDSAIYNTAPIGTSSGLIFELLEHLDCKPMQLRCRIVALCVLVLEKKSGKYDEFQLRTHSTAHFDIPLAGFILDDGSSSCCCWADGERAATLLRLHEELPQNAPVNNRVAMNWIGIDNNDWRITSNHLERILKKHERITVINYGSLTDTSYQDLSVSVSSESSLSSSDEKLLKLIIWNACFGSFWTLVASVINSSAIRWLEKEQLAKLEAPMHSMQNLWVREVHRADPITEARNVYQELVDRKRREEGDSCSGK